MIILLFEPSSIGYVIACVGLSHTISSFTSQADVAAFCIAVGDRATLLLCRAVDGRTWGIRWCDAYVAFSNTSSRSRTYR